MNTSFHLSLDCEQSVFVRENPTSDKKSPKYANEGKERGENKARHEKNLFLGDRASRGSRLRRSPLALRFDRERFYYTVAH